MEQSALYGPIDRSVWLRLSQIRLLICDVDGVLSDGLIYLGNQGEEFKTFNTKDGFGMKALINAGIEVAIITGRDSRIVADRMAALGVKHVYQGQSDKRLSFNALLTDLNLNAEQVAYIGDDVVDLTVMELCGLGVAVSDAHPLVRQRADYVTQLAGGRGCVRELCDLMLEARGILHLAQGMSV
ncbi:3-deoxy-D-manno-octulosonate 8-phosphate phosphatase [Oceanisphaera profunda]|uniref:3-deoxy-D-manno-octulosonate 8-phosphate phosphatase KdsC n=1 Tax=Oceanisphaera profunda TaxID=1416627 RepID=A0A1Y0D6R0_9GAMM|nr:3-deoxy-manno-octulosonate-8-phosphatase KdsC [Oceanisphaera profunda]ART82856.1 3-deoxy-D-manno-octulosonate 8-phosphate phosphatase [Oceanisphaera profunda]